MRFGQIGVRELAAADMWGSAGTLRRRRIIRAEFFAGVGGCLALGIVSLTVPGGGWQVAIGIWLIGVGANYVPLALYSHVLMRPGALEQELQGRDISRELRRATVAQLWIVVPFAVAVSAIGERRHTRSRSG